VGETRERYPGLVEFYERMLPTLRNYARRLLWSYPAETDDVVSRVVEEMMTKWDSIEPQHREPQAMMRTRSRCIDFLRKQEPIVLVADTEPYVERAAGPAGPGSAARIEPCLDRLPKVLRDTVILTYYADLPSQEVARALARSAGTVRNDLTKAVRLLRECLGEGLSGAQLGRERST